MGVQVQVEQMMTTPRKVCSLAENIKPKTLKSFGNFQWIIIINLKSGLAGILGFLHNNNYYTYTIQH